MSKHVSKPSRILIVSENLPNGEILEKSLAEEEYKIGIFCNVRVALKIIPAYEPDLILLDLSNSDWNGREICRRMKSEIAIRTIPLLVVISLNEMGDIENAVAAGCDEFLTTPVNESELRSRVRSLLGRDS